MQQQKNRLTQREEFFAKEIADCAFKVHTQLGPGLLEKIYEGCFCYELAKKGIEYQRQIDIPITYDRLVFEEGLRLDVLLEDSIICELKAIELVNPLWQAQIISHLKLTRRKLGSLINFNVSTIKEGIKRLVV